MDTVDRFIQKEGIEPILDEIGDIVRDNVEPHEFAMDSKVEMGDWFEFLWTLDDAVTPRARNLSTLAVPEFNYVEVEDEFVEFVDNNSPVEYGKIVDHVYNSVDSVDEKEQVARWCEFVIVETDERDRIVKAKQSY